MLITHNPLSWKSDFSLKEYLGRGGNVGCCFSNEEELIQLHQTQRERNKGWNWEKLMEVILFKERERVHFTIVVEGKSDRHSTASFIMEWVQSKWKLFNKQSKNQLINSVYALLTNSKTIVMMLIKMEIIKEYDIDDS